MGMSQEFSMTRINADLDPYKLLDAHCIAEYRELPMVFASLRRSLRTKSKQDVLKSIPKNFTLNAGHVKFFYDKLLFLQERYEKLRVELKLRNFKLDDSRSYDLSDIPIEFRTNGYLMSGVDSEIIRERLITRFMAKPTWYRYYGKPIDIDRYNAILN
jgi:deoxyribonuclease (pyrimidine dimer)